MTVLDDVLAIEDEGEQLNAALSLLGQVRDLVPHAEVRRNRVARENLDLIASLVGRQEEPNAEAPSERRTDEVVADGDPDTEASVEAEEGDGGTAVDLDAMSKADLVVLAEKLGLDKKGNKPDLIARIVEHAGSTSDDEPSEDVEPEGEPEPAADGEPEGDEQSGDADAEEGSEPASGDAEEPTPDDAAGEE